MDTPLVGRGAELARLAAALARVRAGTGGVVVVVGEAGIGKTRLIAEADRGTDGTWLEGRCVSYGESLPYWPIRDVVRDWLGVVADDPELRVRVRLRRAVDEVFGPRTMEAYPYLCSLMGLAPEVDAAARLADLAPEALQYRTFEVVEDLPVELAADRPLVVHLEDLHWADTTSVQLVERLLTIGERAAVLLVITLRDERDHPSWVLREQAAREVPHLLTEIALEPLSGDAEQELLHAIVGPGILPAELEAELLDVADGNPFFLEELIRSLTDVDDWTDLERQVMSGAFRRVAQDDGLITLERRENGTMPRPGEARRVELRRLTQEQAEAAYRADELDIFNTHQLAGAS